MLEDKAGRLLDKNSEPDFEKIERLLGPDAALRLNKLETFLQSNYDLKRELKFPFGDNYGWGYQYKHKSKLLCYVFFEKDAFTVTISIGKNELQGLQNAFSSLLPKTKELWENRYPCGDGGWVHYRVESDQELSDIFKLICIKKKPIRK